MPSFKVAKATEVPPGQGIMVQAGTKTVAICPWHGWRWDVTTGANANNPAVKIGCFPAAVVDGDVYVEMP